MEEDNLNDVHQDIYDSSSVLDSLQDFNTLDLFSQDLLQHNPMASSSGASITESPSNVPDLLITDSLAKNSKQLLFAHLFNYLACQGHYETAKALIVESFEKDLQYLNILNRALDDLNMGGTEQTILTQSDIEKMNLASFDPKEHIKVKMLMQSEGSFLLEWWSILWDLHSSLNKQKVKSESPPVMPPPLSRPLMTTNNSSKSIGKAASAKQRGRKTVPSPSLTPVAAASHLLPQQQLRLKQLQLQQQQLQQQQQQQPQVQQQLMMQQLLLQQQTHNLKQKLLQQQQQQQQQQLPIPQTHGSPVNLLATGRSDASINSMQQAQFIQQQQTLMINRMNNGQFTEKKLTVQSVQAELQYQQEQQKVLMGMMMNANPLQTEQIQWQLQQIQQQQNNLRLLMNNMLQQQQVQRPQGLFTPQQGLLPVVETPHQVFGVNSASEKEPQQLQHNPNGSNYLSDYQIQLLMLENMQRQQIAQQQQLSSTNNANTNSTSDMSSNINNNGGDYRTNLLQQMVGSRLQLLGLDNSHDPAQTDQLFLQTPQHDMATPHNILPQHPFE